MDDTIDSHYVNSLSVETAQSVQAVHLLISGLEIRRCDTRQVRLAGQEWCCAPLPPAAT
jgi:hypothetical protein